MRVIRKLKLGRDDRTYEQERAYFLVATVKTYR